MIFGLAEVMIGTGARTTSPTIVTPPLTTEAARETPRRVTPASTDVAVHVIDGVTVRMPPTEKLQSACDKPTASAHATLAPATVWPPCRSTRPVTVVSGSGTTLTTTWSAVPMLLPRSTASAANVIDVAPTGARTENWYGAVVSLPTV